MTKLGQGLGKLLGLIDDPDESWRKFGKTDPYFGVLTADRFRKENLDEAALRDFFASGEDQPPFLIVGITNLNEANRRSGNDDRHP